MCHKRKKHKIHKTLKLKLKEKRIFNNFSHKSLKTLYTSLLH